MGSRSRGLVRIGVLLLVAGAQAGGSFAQWLTVEYDDFGPGAKQSISLVTDIPGGSYIFMKAGNNDSALSFSAASGKKQWYLGTLDELVLGSSNMASEAQVLAIAGGLVLASDYPSQRYLVDADEDDALANHIWYENSTGGATDWRMMQLTEASGGSLFVDGPVTQNHSFDLAEAFWEREAIEPGELVAVDSERPDAVRLTTSPYQAALLGVASANPGFVLGGGAFSLEALGRTWGVEVAEEYQRQRPELEQWVFRELPDLADEAARLRSLASFEEDLARRRLEFEADTLLEGRTPRSARAADQEISPESLRRAYDKARGHYEESMFDRTVQRFFKDRFTTVALAGRVPVKVDAAFGAIRPGDFLTSSPVAGVAMKATGPGPVVGIALEPLAQGGGLIQVFVHRGWYGGEGLPLAGARPAEAAVITEAKDREIAELKSRLAALEARLDTVTSARAGFTVSSVENSPNPEPSSTRNGLAGAALSQRH